MAFEVFDDVAFYWFLMSVLIAVLLPLSYSFIKNEILGLVTPRKDWTWNLTSCRAKNYQLANKRRTETIYTFLGFKSAFFFLGWITFIYMLTSLSTMQQQDMATFDPFKILQIPEDADDRMIKKAYRKLSLKWHPDKNPNDKAASNKFVELTKAYAVMQNEESRKNYEKFGNPDGYSGTSVTIGWPSFLTDGDNELAILISYFIVMIIIIPLVSPASPLPTAQIRVVIAHPFAICVHTGNNPLLHLPGRWWVFDGENPRSISKTV